MLEAGRVVKETGAMDGGLAQLASATVPQERGR